MMDNFQKVFGLMLVTVIFLFLILLIDFRNKMNEISHKCKHNQTIEVYEIKFKCEQMRGKNDG